MKSDSPTAWGEPPRDRIDCRYRRGGPFYFCDFSRPPRNRQARGYRRRGDNQSLPRIPRSSMRFPLEVLKQNKKRGLVGLVGLRPAPFFSFFWLTLKEECCPFLKFFKKNKKNAYIDPANCSSNRHPPPPRKGFALSRMRRMSKQAGRRECWPAFYCRGRGCCCRRCKKLSL